MEFRLSPEEQDAIALLARTVAKRTVPSPALRDAYITRITATLNNAVEEHYNNLDNDCPKCAAEVRIADRNYCPRCDWREVKR